MPLEIHYSYQEATTKYKQTVRTKTINHRVHSPTKDEIVSFKKKNTRLNSKKHQTAEKLEIKAIIHH